MSHFIERCRACNTVISQCRCPELTMGKKSERWVERCCDCINKMNKSTVVECDARAKADYFSVGGSDF